MQTRYPAATWRPSPNHDAGRNGHPIRAVVMHISQGSYTSGVSWLTNPASGVSAHFIISEAGAVTQMVELDNTAWANGLSWTGGRWFNSRAKVVTPRWELVEPGVSPNRTTISVELAGYTDKPRPAPQTTAAIALLAWIAQQVGLRYEVGRTLIGHSWLDNIDRPQCPGRYVDLLALADAANARIAPPTPPTRPYRTRLYTPVLETPGTGALQVAWQGGCVLPPGQVIDLSQGPPGWLHWQAGGFVEAAAVEAVGQAAPTSYTADSPVLGTPSYDPAKLATAVQQRCLAAGSPYAAEGERPILTAIIPAYLTCCEEGGVDVFVALAQTLHETGNLTSALSQRNDKDGRPLRNPAGIGVNGDTSARPAPGFVWDADRNQYRRCVGFPSWEEAVAAHVGRLIAWAAKPGERTIAQAALVGRALAYRPLDTKLQGSAATLKLLGAVHNPTGQGWADPGDRYGEGLAEIAEVLRKAAQR